MSLLTVMYQMQSCFSQITYKCGNVSLLNIRFSQAAYQGTQQEASTTIPPTTTSTTRLRWSASRRTWRGTWPGRSASRLSWGYAAPKVRWQCCFLSDNVFFFLHWLAFFVCFKSLNPLPIPLAPCRSVHPHVPRKLLCALHGFVVPPQREPGRGLRSSDVHRRKLGRHAGRLIPGGSALYIQQRYTEEGGEGR